MTKRIILLIILYSLSIPIAIALHTWFQEVIFWWRTLLVVLLLTVYYHTVRKWCFQYEEVDYEQGRDYGATQDRWIGRG